MADNKKIQKTILQQFAIAPDTQLDSSYSRVCRWVYETRADDMDLDSFYQDLRDMCVHTGGCNPFVMGIFNALVGGVDEGADERREDLPDRWKTYMDQSKEYFEVIPE